MNTTSPFFAILSNENQREFANQIASALGYDFAHIHVGTIEEAVSMLDAQPLDISSLLIDVGHRSHDTLAALDALAQHCSAETKVVVMGQTNDIAFYRALIQRGVSDYVTYPVDIGSVRDAFMQTTSIASTKTEARRGNVITFSSAAAGDGSSTIALNTAFCLANDFHMPTVIVDFDYQFGMIAKNLDLTSPFGIKEIFDHPDRGIDNTLIERMVVKYKKNLDVIAAPNELRYIPAIQPESIRDLINALRQNYACIILDLPHLWSPWLSSAISNADNVVIVSQLWLKSVMHAARLINAYRDIGVTDDMIHAVINRSGSKFKEAVDVKDFERVTAKTISHYFANDIKTVVTAENEGTTVLEIGKSRIAEQLCEFSSSLLAEEMTESATDGKNSLGFNLLKRLT